MTYFASCGCLATNTGAIIHGGGCKRLEPSTERALRLTIAGLREALEKADAARVGAEMREVRLAGDVMELRTVLAAAVAWVDTYDGDRECTLVQSAGCIDCTRGTVPNYLNTGRCWIHAAKRALLPTP